MPVGKSSLLRAGKAVVEAPKATLPQANIVTVAVADIQATPTGFSKDKRVANVELIKKYGVTEPVLLWEDGGVLRIIRGNGTLSACTALQIASVPAVIVRISQEEAKSLAKALNTEPSGKAEKAKPAAKAQPKTQKIHPIHEQKFNAIKTIKKDLPYYLL